MIKKVREMYTSHQIKLTHQGSDTRSKKIPAGYRRVTIKTERENEKVKKRQKEERKEEKRHLKIF